MPRTPREDRPGALHHVTSRGQGQIPVYETFADVNCFTGLLAEAAARKQVEILAYAVLSTHIHLVVRSVEGDLAAEMQRLFGLYAMWFNRTRGHKGHVFGGRYHDVVIQDDVQLAFTVTYSDFNAVVAGMAASPDAYPHSSARHYLDPRPPEWLSTDRIRALACRIARTSTFSPDAYFGLWRACHGRDLAELVERSLRAPRVPLAPLEVLTRAGPDYVQRWLRENTLREQGRATPVLAVPSSVLLRALADVPREGCERALTAGLLHTLSGLSIPAVAVRLSVSRATACRALAMHTEALAKDGAYAQRAAGVVDAALRAAYGAIDGRTGLPASAETDGV